MVGAQPLAVRKPEKRTAPKLFYRGAHEATLDPLAARRPPGGLFMWSEQGEALPGRIVAGVPTERMSSAAAVLAYDVPHSSPWGWKVSLYTWTKSIGAGAYLAVLLLALLGFVSWSASLWTMAAPVVSGAFVGLTGVLLVWDLKHPERFYLIFTRPQWRSWLVRGAFVIVGYSAVLAAHAAAGVAGRADALRWLAVAGLPLAALTAAYTAFLFAQARARDLWQGAMLPAHFLVQSLVGGAAAMLFVALFVERDAVLPLAWLLAGSSAAHLVFVAAEVLSDHGAAHKRLAVWELTSGSFGALFKAAAVLAALSIGAPLASWAAIAAAAAALAGLVAYEHAYVQAGQIVPLA
jgi:formate-dependent nitrite reductase membrane component NrfD